MLRTIFNYLLTSGERQLGESVDWARYMLKTSIGATLKYFMFIPFSTHGRKASSNEITVARLISVKKESCGSCVQIEINLAKQFGVKREVIQSTLRGEYSMLGPNLELVAKFSESILTQDGNEMELKRKLVEIFGEKIHVEICLALATAKVYPIAKRAMGFATACNLDTFKI
jgi:predicted nucleotidyltransferase